MIGSAKTKAGHAEFWMPQDCGANKKHRTQIAIAESAMDVHEKQRRLCECACERDIEVERRQK